MRRVTTREEHLELGRMKPIGHALELIGSGQPDRNGERAVIIRQGGDIRQRSGAADEEHPSHRHRLTVLVMDEAGNQGWIWAHANLR